jgi:3-deoxy-D-manno-octulosonate 8-phosphate phosphatase (KDO 8-P phosphatase)
MNRILLQKIKKVKLLLLDVDGVLTDGRIIYDSKGCDLKFFDVHDGLGVHILKTMGIKTILVTAKASGTIKHRAKDMGVVEIYEDAIPKTEAFMKILKKYKVEEDEVCFIGDDLVDLSVLKRVGFAVAVSNACNEVKRVASYITKKEGGRGAVREVAELILRTQKKWKKAIKVFEK